MFPESHISRNVLAFLFIPAVQQAITSAYNSLSPHSPTPLPPLLLLPISARHASSSSIPQSNDLYQTNIPPSQQPPARMQYPSTIYHDRINEYALQAPLAYLSGTAKGAFNTLSRRRTSRRRRHASRRRSSHSSVMRSCYSTLRVSQPSSVG
jgi:hypothetical protein